MVDRWFGVGQFLSGFMGQLYPGGDIYRFDAERFQGWDTGTDVIDWTSNRTIAGNIYPSVLMFCILMRCL